MRSRFLTLLGVSLMPATLGHKTMGILIVNQTAAPEWLYVRDVMGPAYEDEVFPWGQFHKTVPMMDIHHPDITCGRKAYAAAPNTSTADVLAGGEVGFRVNWDADGPGGRFYHRGPAQIYLSRAPNDDLEHYRGDGDWFKIAIAGPENNNKWSLWPSASDFNFSIPLTTPPGRYLMRIEQFWPTNSYNYSQWFVNCAHVNIIGEGGGNPAGFAKFPGTYDIDDPGIRLAEDQMVNGGVKAEDMRLLAYKPPGPAVWTG
ncbi:glycosyl hydrolase family 61-domain-containing protein [Apiosordaria backusii]|uniref:lytic cellulose monooxygenase (C4-dehydrogenating) n=1 Tax=Apiosordaria backusii TaxID=314023 RepID=A0AA40DN07_9PEZI|nr:glycosyl hydrolase family 61-domain-containing protein [Apiosordaria backusii]